MTEQEKQQIRNYRESGVSYIQISREMKLSLNSIKTFCRRNNLCSNDFIDSDDFGHCHYCRKKIEQTPGKKKKKFCSDKCRMLWWNSHLDQVDRKANYKIVCANCGKIFISYGNKNRKYCCHACYIKGRFRRSS